LHAAHKLEAYSWLLDDVEAMRRFEEPRAFIGEPMLIYFAERHEFELPALA
jgi:hypothetical protein